MAVVVPAPLPVAPDFHACRALVIDPFVANRRLLRDMLHMVRVGDVEACGSVLQASSQLEGGPWTMLFLDWSCELDAIAFLHDLRQEGNPHRFLPVVVVSGFDSRDHVRRARDFGTTEYMLKPYSVDVLKSRVRSIVEMPRLYVESDDFFGPDRRRRRIPVEGDDRRHHENWRRADRRMVTVPWQSTERRQANAAFKPQERRGGGRM